MRCLKACFCVLTRSVFWQVCVSWAGVTIFLLCAVRTSISADELPPPEQIRSDLQNHFAVTRVPDIHSGPGPLARAWFKLAQSEVAGLRRQLRTWEKDPRAKLLTDGRHREHGIRPNTQAMITFAAIARWSPDARERQETLADLIAMLRFIAPTHSVGPMTTADDRKWQSQWQSALWAFYTGIASWIIWEQIPDDELRWLIANCIAREADRFVEAEPPFQIKYDTKAEENAWNSTVVALAANMFPQHPHRDRWLETANRWQLSSFLTEDDVRRNPVVDGRTLREWRLQANIHSDYTLENHHRVHPSYMAAITLLSGQHFLYTWGGRPAPEALDFNCQRIYEHLKYLSHTDGRTHHPNGQDWELTRYTPKPHAVMNVLFQDREAARLERVTLESARRLQARTADGTTLLPSEYFFPSLPHAYAFWYGIGFLFHSVYGEGVSPVSQRAFERNQEGVRCFTNGEFVAHRTRSGFASFAWGNRVMGMAIPFGNDLLGSPYELGYVGALAVTGVPASVDRSGRPTLEVPEVKHIKVFHTNDHFHVAGTLNRAGGKIEQQIVFVSLPEGRVFYAEQLKALEAVELTALKTAQIGVLNMPESPFQNGPRVLRWEAGQARIDGFQEHAPFAIPSRWINIDKAWGFIALTGENWRYEPQHAIERGRREQFLHLSPPEQTRFGAGEIIARRAVVTTLGQTARQTRRSEQTLRRDFHQTPQSLGLRLSRWAVETTFASDRPVLTVERR